MIHLAFPRLQHGDSFENYYIDSLLNGHMVFDGRGIVTEVTKPKPAVDSQIALLQIRKKKLETKLKRTTTAIKRIDRKIKHLEKKKEEDI